MVSILLLLFILSMSEPLTISKRKYDIIIFGATGFTGRLCARYLAESKIAGLRWAIAGRNSDKLKQVKDDTLKLFPGSEFDTLVGDVSNQDSLDRLFSQAKVIIATAGPFANLGIPVVDACVRNNAHYVDITGEPQFVREVIDKYHNEASSKRLKIVNCCGFDCIPSDLGCMMIADKLIEQGLKPVEVKMVFGDGRGEASGGTIRTIINIFETMALKSMKDLMNPFYLCPNGPIISTPTCNISDSNIRRKADDLQLPEFDPVFKGWTAPYFMQSIDTRIVNRSNAVSGYKYGKSFVYSESMAVAKGILGAIGALFISMAMGFGGLLLALPLSRYMLKKILPQSGDGPSEATMKAGYIKMLFYGTGENTAAKSVSESKKTVFGGVIAKNGDPGYLLTSKMVCNAALCLALNEANDQANKNTASPPSQLPANYGVLTPSTAFGYVLIDRLRNAGFDFFIAENKESLLRKTGINF